MLLPKGFRFSGVPCGIKTQPNTKDISLIVSDVPAVAAGVYTQNQVVAAPVTVCQSKTPSSKLRGVVVNSGNANACTGEQGMTDANRMCQLTAELCEVDESQVLVMSTGVIGQFLPMTKVEQGIQASTECLAEGEDAFLAAADGILTTDKARKIATREVHTEQGTIRIAGIAKGAGMIGPNMATMLCCVVTDADLSEAQAQEMLRTSADLSFNNVSVEGHTSTNDTMLLLANGQAKAGSLANEAEQQFQEALTDLCIQLAKLIPADGEGASHLIEVRVKGSQNDGDARKIATSVASSNLVKTAVYGNDPNWGRIVSAAGYAGPELDHSRLQLKMNGITLFDAGEPIEFDAAAASESIRTNETTEIELVVGSGPGICTHWTSDLTVDYVTFNSEYTT